MSNIFKLPGGLTTKAAGPALVTATLNNFHLPRKGAGDSRKELRRLPCVHQNFYSWNLPDAKPNHDRMLTRAASVQAANIALLPVAYPNMVAAPVVTAEIALVMLSALFAGVGKVKNVDTETLLAACIGMFNPVTEIVGEATELWTPISKHPAVLALALSKVVNTAAFTSAAEFRAAIAPLCRAGGVAAGEIKINRADRTAPAIPANTRVGLELCS